MTRTGPKPPSKQKDRAPPSSTSRPPPQTQKPNPTEPLRAQQQQCLDIFRDAFRPGPDDQAVLQEVKGHLYNRDFAAAFGRDDYLRVYASRWSPSRALAYLQVLKDVESCVGFPRDSEREAVEIVCVGGGAGGELVGLAAWFSLLYESGDVAARKLYATLVDIADWSTTIETLGKHITTPPELSKYASQAKKDANRAMLGDEAISIQFQQQDVLSVAQTPCPALSDALKSAALVTFMFTLNELYSTSTAKTQNLLSLLTSTMTLGSCLLVVDSPGSYSTVSINGAEKKYPMHWLLDLALLGSPATRDDGQSGRKWEKVVSDDSRWFRLSTSLQYPIDLEDMRYQIHLYRRVSDVGG